MYRPIISALIGGLFVIAMSWFGLAALAGAHPGWDMQVALIGAPLGALLAMLLGWMERVRAAFIAGVVTSALAYALALRGKAAFAASYAEDQLAGMLWYNGWIGLCVGVTLALSAVLNRASIPAGRRSAPPPLV